MKAFLISFHFFFFEEENAQRTPGRGDDMSRLVMLTVSIVLFVVLVPVSTVNAGGSAAHYDPSYDVEWWEDAMDQHASWGNAIPNWSYDPNGYYCVRPRMAIGQRLWLRNAAGEVASCTIGDSVQKQHEVQWWSKWIVEVNWPLFVRLGLQHNNYVEVLSSPPVVEWYFLETEKTVSEPFWSYWNQFGDFSTSVAIFGYPMSEVEVDPETGLKIQRFERAVLEYDGNRVIGRRVVAERYGDLRLEEFADFAEGRFFPETGHYVSGDFLDFWGQFEDGRTSISVFGYPISPAYREMNGVLVQQFERVIMELHSGEPEGERVKLRLIADMKAS